MKMTDCDICKLIESKDAFKVIYEDDICLAILHESPSVSGHCLVIPKKHSTIIEETDDEVVEHIFVVANKVSSAIFDTLGAHGTNIVLNNGADAGQELPHVVVNVIPRKENDPLNLEWQPKQASQEELKTTSSMMKVYAEHIYSGKDKLPEVKIKKEEPAAEKEEGKKEDDYLVKGLKRMP
ncbi:HIT family protein [Candidatus Woesearchaeota archaeon]|nr:HIT family protein [Candidatus Woesearchaeota archaeon]